MILVGHNIIEMRKLPEKSVHCVVTSPPYWGLRAYGTDPQVWGGDAGCEHEWSAQVTPARTGGNGAASSLHIGSGLTPVTIAAKLEAQRVPEQQNAICKKCGAWCGELGSEPTPEMFVAHMVEVFAEVWRVLRDDGTCWVNLGDTYSGYHGNKNHEIPTSSTNGWTNGYNENKRGGLKPQEIGLKPKDLVGIPWRVAFALQEWGWYLRQDIIWHKPNPMPESVQDRCTKAHEYLFLFTKGQRTTRTVKFLNLQEERIHLIENVLTNPTYSAASRLCIRFASSILESAQRQQGFSLPALYSQVWKQLASCNSSHFTAELPPQYWVTAQAARFLSGDSTTKEFLGELNRVGCDLTDRQHLLIGGRATELLLTPKIHADGKGAIAIHDASNVGKIDFTHGHIVFTVPTTCNYFFDAEAIKTPVSRKTLTVHTTPRKGNGTESTGEKVNLWMEQNGGRYHPLSANRRSVWSVSTYSYKGAHFATFPPRLVEPCILAGTSAAGCCSHCGKPWDRVIESQRIPTRPGTNTKVAGANSRLYQERDPQHGSEYKGDRYALEVGNRDPQRHIAVKVTTGWQQSCKCDAHEAVPCTVLDPFGGSGTTAIVAAYHGRNWLLCELNEKYAELARARIADGWTPPKAKSGKKRRKKIKEQRSLFVDC